MRLQYVQSGRRLELVHEDGAFVRPDGQFLGPTEEVDGWES